MTKLHAILTSVFIYLCVSSVEAEQCHRCALLKYENGDSRGSMTSDIQPASNATLSGSDFCRNLMNSLNRADHLLANCDISSSCISIVASQEPKPEQRAFRFYFRGCSEDFPWLEVVPGCFEMTAEELNKKYSTPKFSSPDDFYIRLYFYRQMNIFPEGSSVQICSFPLLNDE